MNRWVSFGLCAIIGIAVVLCGLLVPAHLRAVDSTVIEWAGLKTPPGLIERGIDLIRERKLGAAQLLFRAAQHERLSKRELFGDEIADLVRRQPGLQLLGSEEPRLENLFNISGQRGEQELKRLERVERSETDNNKDTDPELAVLPHAKVAITDFILSQTNREHALGLLSESPHPLAQQLLRCRTLTNTVIFPPSASAAGQAFDAALGLAGLLLEERRMAPGLSNSLFTAAGKADSDPQTLEQVLLDLMTLGQRLNWGQLIEMITRVEDPETMRLLANFARKEEFLPILFSAVQLSGQPAAVVNYLVRFGQTGPADLAKSVQYGVGGVRELLQRSQRLYSSKYPQRVLVDYCLQIPQLALIVKWLLYLGGGFLLAMSLHFARGPASVLESPLEVRGAHIAREILFALGFLLVVLLLSEPFLAHESQKVDFPFRLRLPMVGSALPVRNPFVNNATSIMNPLSLLTLLLFFVLQGLLYAACLVKLAEIRRQRVLPRVKLRLLENEDHLFDAGLYLGFVGTIISLILVSLGVIKPSLMAAYSSTSFGIIFVSIFKIFHLRPLRRKLLMESEAAAPEPMAQAAVRTFATAP